MLTSQSDTSEASILDRISMARGSAEPAQAEPTGEPEAVEVSEEAPEESVEEVVDDSQPLESEESEELESDGIEASSSESDDDEDLFVEYKGREINLKDIEEWEQGSLRQSDYTRKTQDLAEQRKAFEAEREAFKGKTDSLDSHIATLEAMISEDTLTAEQVAEMREYEPEEYIKHAEKMAKRKRLLEEAKAAQGQAKASEVDVAGERKKLWDANPEWLDKDGNQSKQFKDDMTMLQSYAQKEGYTDAEINGLTEFRHWNALLKAARYDSMKKQSASIEKRVRKALVTTKPRKATQSNAQAELKKAQERLARTGSVEDAIAVRKLKRKL